MNRFHGLMALLGSAAAAALPYVDVGGALITSAQAITTAHPWAAPLTSVGLAMLANHAPSLFKPRCP